MTLLTLPPVAGSLPGKSLENGWVQGVLQDLPTPARPKK
jgi:hypothetical protein